MDINKEICMVVKTKFQDIKEELDRDYNRVHKFTDHQNETYDCRFTTLKKAVDELLTLLDKAVS